MAEREPARPSVTIVIATHARPEFLADCVASIAAGMRAGDDLVVMECCNPEAPSQLQGFAVPLVHVSEAHGAKCVKLNRAVRQAAHDVVLLTDDDCRVPPDWVDAMARPFANPAVGFAFGRVSGLSALPGGTAEPVVPAGPAPAELWNYAHGASMAVRRAAVLDAGGFDERLGAGTAARGGEEADLVLRMQAGGWTGEVAGGTPVHHLGWRDESEDHENVLGYQRGSGAYLGAGLRRDARATAKTLCLRLRHEAGIWHDRQTRGAGFGPRMSAAFAAGLVRGALLAPRRYLDPEPRPRPARSHGRTRVLWVTDEPPDRDRGGGGNIRQARLLDSLRSRMDVTLLVAGTLDDAKTRACVSAVIEVAAPRVRAPQRAELRRARDLAQGLVGRRPTDVARAARVRRALQPVLERIADDFDVVVVHHLYLAPLLPPRRHAAWVLHLFDVSSGRTRHEVETVAGTRQRWLLRREAGRAERYEREVVAAYDRVVVVSEEDVAALGGTGPLPASRAPVVVANGVDVYRKALPLPASALVLLPATLDYRPNVLGAIWFCDEVWERVRNVVPGARFALVGRRPAAEVAALAERDGVELHADVADMAEWFDRARVVVVPLWAGTGTRLKALEAMAAGRPVVGTTIGLEGLGCVDGVHARIEDDPAAMAAAIVELLVCDTAAVNLAIAARRLVEERFPWPPIAECLASALAAAAESQIVPAQMLAAQTLECSRERSVRRILPTARPGSAPRPVGAGDV